MATLVVTIAMVAAVLVLFAAGDARAGGPLFQCTVNGTATPTGGAPSSFVTMLVLGPVITDLSGKFLHAHIEGQTTDATSPSFGRSLTGRLYDFDGLSRLRVSALESTGTISPPAEPVVRNWDAILNLSTLTGTGNFTEVGFGSGGYGTVNISTFSCNPTATDP